MRNTSLVHVSLLLSALALPQMLRADWLVTVDGQRIETKGGWETKPSSVEYHDTAGVLRSLPLRAVDLDASKAATAQQAAAAEKAPMKAEEPARSLPTQKRTGASALTLTDSDVRHVARRPEGESGGGEGEQETADAGDKEQSADNPLQVSDWQELRRPNGLRIAGTLANTGPDMATLARLEVTILGPEGKLAATSRAVLTSTTIPPGQSTGFYVDFDGQQVQTGARFSPAAEFIVTHRSPTETDQGSDESFSQRE